jgi:hypothetical protein
MINYKNIYLIFYVKVVLCLYIFGPYCSVTYGPLEHKEVLIFCDWNVYTASILHWSRAHM